MHIGRSFQAHCPKKSDIFMKNLPFISIFNRKGRFTLVDAHKYTSRKEEGACFLGGFDGLKIPYMHDFCSILLHLTMNQKHARRRRLEHTHTLVHSCKRHVRTGSGASRGYESVWKGWVMGSHKSPELFLLPQTVCRSKRTSL